MEEKNVIGVKPKVVNEEKITTEVYEDIFVLVTRKGKTQIAIRNSIIVRDEFDTVEAAKNYIDAKPWKLLVNTVLFIAEDVKNNKL